VVLQLLLLLLLLRLSGFVFAILSQRFASR